MSLGYAHVFVLPHLVDPNAPDVRTYQFTFNANGEAYSRILNEHELAEFLMADLGFVREALEAAMTELKSTGRVTIRELDFSDNQAAAMGMEKVGSDY